jgi:hypothetical protein
MGGLGRQVPSPPVLCARDAVHGLNSPLVNMRTLLVLLCAVHVARAVALVRGDMGACILN